MSYCVFSFGIFHRLDFFNLYKKLFDLVKDFKRRARIVDN